MAVATGYLLTGLAQFPDANLEPPVYAAIAQVHFALKNLDTALELALGLIKYDESELGTVYLSQAFTGGSLNRIYVLPNGTVNIGDFVSVGLSGGLTKAAQATPGALTYAVGICTASIGSYREITMGHGCITGIFAGLVAGTSYWLSTTTAGAMQNTRPAGVAINKQFLGWALDPTTFMLNATAPVGG